MKYLSRLLFSSLIGLFLTTAFAQTPVKPQPSAPAKPVVQVDVKPKLEILATINSFNVTRPWLERQVELRFARQVMEQIIRDRVIEDAAQAQGIKVSTEQVTEAITRQRQEFSSDQDFINHIWSLGFTTKGYRENTRTQLLIDGLLAKTSTVSDKELRAYYDAHRAEFSGQSLLHLQAFTAPRDDALLAYRTILDGTPFAIAAQRYSSATPLADKADLGWVNAATVPVQGIWPTAEGLAPGQTSAPIQVEGKWYLLRVIERKAGAPRTFEQAKNEIRSQLQNGVGITAEELIADLMMRAKITVNWEPVAYMNAELAARKATPTPPVTAPVSKPNAVPPPVVKPVVAAPAIIEPAQLAPPEEDDMASGDQGPLTLPGGPPPIPRTIIAPEPDSGSATETKVLVPAVTEPSTLPAGPIQLVLDTEQLILTGPPFVSPKGVLMVPILPIMDKLNGTVSIAPDDNIAQIAWKGIRLTLVPGETTLVAQGRSIVMPDASQMRGKLLFVPARAILEALGMKIDWKPASRLLTVISTPAADKP